MGKTSNIFSKIGYHAVYSFWYALSLLPMWLLYVLSDIMFFMLAIVVKYRKKTIENNLQTAFPEKTEMERKIIVYKFYHTFCDYIVETIKLMSMSERQLRCRMRFEGIEEMNKILQGGQSVALFLSHTFNWEWISTITLWVPEGVICGEVYHPLENKVFDRLILDARQKNHAVGVPMKDTLRQIVSWKRDGIAHVMGYLYDQKPHWHNIHHWVNFLNHDTPVLTGAERICKATDQAVVYGDMMRKKRGYYECRLKVMTTKPKEQEDWKITDWYYQQLEETVRRQPELWLWSHKRWKRTREEFDRRYKLVNGKVVRRDEA